MNARIVITLIIDEETMETWSVPRDRLLFGGELLPRFDQYAVQCAIDEAEDILKRELRRS